MKMRFKLSLILLGAVLLVSCAQTTNLNSFATSFLQYIPENTPYVVLINAQQDAEPALGFWDMIEPLLVQVRSKMDHFAVGERSGLMREELKLFLSKEGFESNGIDTQGGLALYAVNFSPVLRMGLHNSGAFGDFLVRIKSIAGGALEARTIAGIDYWIFGEGKEHMLLAQHNNNAIVSIYSAEFITDNQIKSILGESLPDASLLNASFLTDLMERQNYSHQGVVYFDSAKFSQQLFEQYQQRDLVKSDETTQDTCSDDIAQFGELFPLLSGGFVDQPVGHVQYKWSLELNPDLVELLNNVTVEVPGLMTSSNRLNIGVGLDVDKAKEFSLSLLEQIAAIDYQCDYLSSLDTDLSHLQEVLAGPLKYAVGIVKGFAINVDQIYGSDGELDLQASARIETASPLLLYRMVSGFYPDLKALQVFTDELVHSFPRSLLPNKLDQAQFALSDDAIVLSVGSSDETAVTDWFAAEPANLSPLLYASYDVETLKNLIESKQGNNFGAQRLSPGLAIVNLYSDQFRRGSLGLFVGDHGIELHLSGELK